MLFLSCVLCFRARLFIDALWSPAGKGLASWLSFVMSNNCEFVTFPFGILGQVWYLNVSIPDLCRVSYFNSLHAGAFYANFIQMYSLKYYLCLYETISESAKFINRKRNANFPVIVGIFIKLLYQFRKSLIHIDKNSILKEYYVTTGPRFI